MLMTITTTMVMKMGMITRIQLKHPNAGAFLLAVYKLVRFK